MLLLHLLLTPLASLVTDHSEYVAVARRLAFHGTLTLADEGVTRAPEAPWAKAFPPRPFYSRLLPLTSVLEVPLVVVDRALRLDGPPDQGTLVYLLGHVLTLAALLLLGAALRRSGSSEPAVALAVLLCGCAWPVWQVARRGGPEPILLLLVVAFLAAPHLWPRRVRLVQGAIVLLLPWTNPTGQVVSVSLLAAEACGRLLETRGPAATLRAVAPLAACVVAGIALQTVVWNGVVHGNLLLGGYAVDGPQQFFQRSFPAGIAGHLRDLLPSWAPALLLAALAVRRRGEPAIADLLPFLATATALVLFFATFGMPEPARRLAVASPALAWAAGRAADAVRLRAPWPLLAVAATLVIAMREFIVSDGRRYLAWSELFWPSTFWVRWSAEGHGPAAAIAVVVLGSGAVVAALRTLDLLRRPCGMIGPEA